MVDLGVVRQEGHHDRDADAAAEIADQAEHRGRLGPKARRQGREGHGAERHEDEAQAQALDQAAADDVPGRAVGREPRHLPQGEGGQQQAGENQQAGVDPADQAADQEHRDHGAKAARRQDVAGGDHRVAQQALQEGRQEGQGRQEDDADDEDEQQAGHQVAVAEQIRVEERPVCGQGVDHEQIEAETHHDRLEHDLARREPVERLAAIQHQLQGADREAEQAKAEPVERPPAIAQGLRHEGEDAEQRQDAERQIDVEDPAPVVEIGQIAAQRRAQDRADHHAHAPKRHGAAMLLARIGVEQDRLGERHQARAKRPLEQPEQDQLLERGGRTAQHRGEGEAGDGDQEQPLAAEPGGQKAGRRGHDRRRHDVGGQDPGDLLLSRRQAALHVGQRDIGDGRVQRLHDRRQHDRERDQAAPRCRSGRLRRRPGHGTASAWAGAAPSQAMARCSMAAPAGSWPVSIAT